MERAGLATGVVSCGDPGPLPVAGVAFDAGDWAAGWEEAGAVVAEEAGGLAALGGTTAATGLACTVVVLVAPLAPRPAALVCPGGRAGEKEPWAAAEGEAAGADESGTDATGRCVAFTVGAEGVVDEGAGLVF